jgi:hypothetical protein
MIEAIYKLYPQVRKTVGDIAYDIDGNEVPYDLEEVQNKFIEMQAEEEAKKQAEINAKDSALSKLTALGLTPDEITALVGK